MDSDQDSISSGEAELESWAQPSTSEIELMRQKKALKRLPKNERERMRIEAQREIVQQCLRRKELISAKLASSEEQVEAAGDPLAEVQSVFPFNSALSHPQIVTPKEAIRLPVNQAIYDFAAQHFPFFRSHCNLLYGKEPAYSHRQSRELLLYIHEETSANTKRLYGIGISGSVGTVRSVRMFLQKQ